MPRTNEDANGLLPREDVFAREYVIDLNGTRAAIRAGYAPHAAGQQATDLLKRPQVRAMVDHLKAERAKRLEIDSDDVLRELLRLGFYDVGELFDESGALRPLHEIPVEARRAITSVEVDEERDDEGNVIGHVRKVKMAGKAAALDALGRHLRLFVDRVEHSGKVEIEDAREEIRALIDRARAKRDAPR